MTNDVTLQVLTDPVVNPQTFAMTPIYIGTATQKVAVPIDLGSFSLAIPQSDTGLSYIPNSIDGTIIYWANIGNYSFSSTDGIYFDLALASDNNLSISQISNCAVFFIENDRVVFSATIQSYSLGIADGSIKFNSIQINNKLSVSATGIIIAVISQTSSFEHTETSSAISITEPVDYIQGIRGTINFYYNINDFRIVTINPGDTNPFPYGKVSSLIDLHQSISNTSLSVATILNESIASLQVALENISINPTGYILVPTFYIPGMIDIISSFISDQFMLDFSWATIPFSKSLISNIAPSVVSTSNYVSSGYVTIGYV